MRAYQQVQLYEGSKAVSVHLHLNMSSSGQRLFLATICTDIGVV